MNPTSNDALDLARPDDSATLARLHGRLGLAAADEGTLDVAYRALDSALGRLLVAATPRGLVRIAFETESVDEVLTELAEGISPRVLEAPARLDQSARELEEYLDGRRRTFDLALDLTLAHGFRREVIEMLPSIGYGHTASYRDLAHLVGNPGATRAVGTACARNPIPLVLPCHRVVRADGAIGAYRGGHDAKVALLDLERSAA